MVRKATQSFLSVLFFTGSPASISPKRMMRTKCQGDREFVYITSQSLISYQTFQIMEWRKEDLTHPLKEQRLLSDKITQPVPEIYNKTNTCHCICLGKAMKHDC